MKNKVLNNASWIIGVKIVQSLLGLVVSMLTARYLGPSNFGLINYATSIVAFMIPIMQLGFNNIMVQEFINHPEEEGKTLGTALLSNFISGILCIIGVFTFVSIVNRGELDTIIVCSLYSILLISQSLELTIYWFQSKYLSKYSSLISLFAYVIVSVYKIYLLMSAKNVYWFAVSNAIDYLVIGIISLIVYRKLGGQKLSFSIDKGIHLFRKSHYYILSTLMVTIFAQTDKIMINQMMDSSWTGYYSAAVTCAGLTSFVFGAIIDSFRPSIFEGKRNSNESYVLNMKRLYSIVIYLSLIQSLFMTIFAPIIIHILYGNSFEQAISALRIIVWYTTFSYLGSIRNIWILAENKQKYLLSINLMGALANVILNYLLIPRYGILGAASASLFTQFFTNVITGYIIKELRDNNKIMIQSLNPMILFSMCKKIINTNR